MILKINGNVVAGVEESPVWTLPHIREWLGEFTDQTVKDTGQLVSDIGQGTLEEFMRPFIFLFKTIIMSGIHLVNSYSAEIITIGIVAAAFMMMIGDTHKWAGRGVVVFFLGVIWRMMLN